MVLGGDAHLLSLHCSVVKTEVGTVGQSQECLSL